MAHTNSRIPNLTFWEKRLSYASIGFYEGVGCIEWLDESASGDSKEAASFCCPSREQFPKISATVIRKNCVSVACCMSCGALLERERYSIWLWAGRRHRFLVCGCGCPIWKVSSSVVWKVTSEISKRVRDEERRKELRDGGWRHNKADLRRILSIQEHRCLYCGRSFSSTLPPTRDHILPVVSGGTDSKWNIVMACRSCNSRRETIPFRAYCRLLSVRRGSSALRFIRIRIIEAVSSDVDDEELFAFARAYDFHLRTHGRIFDICRHSKSARSNQKSNRLLPMFSRLLKEIRYLDHA